MLILRVVRVFQLGLREKSRNPFYFYKFREKLEFENKKRPDVASERLNHPSFIKP